MREVERDAFRREPGAQLDDRDHRAAEPFVDRHGVADVVVVAVREDDQVAALGLTLRVRCLGVAGEEGIDVDALAA
jgi:hypothetical protein